MIRQLLLFTASALAYAQQAGPQLSVPVLGYVFDNNAKVIRSISGVPGAAGLDAAISTSTSLDSAFVYSLARVAIANTKEGALGLIQWSGSPRLVSIGTAMGRVTQAAFSPSGDRVAITDGAAVEVWSGLGGDPTETAAFVPDGGVVALAMNQDGAVAAATSNGAILLLTDDARQLAAGDSWSAMAFMPNGTDLLAADAGAQTLVLIQDVQNGAASSIVLTLDQKPGALAVSADGMRAALALANAKAVTVVDLNAGAARSVPCNCEAVNLDPLAGNLVLQMVDAQSGSLLVLDADRAQAQVSTLLGLSGLGLNGVAR
jgi:hypothetical protein